MFGKNEIVGKAFFKDSEKDTLLVTSRFYTIQGEGPFRGFPAYFVRLAKCNLACSFCDTYFDSGTVQTFDKIIEDAQQEILSFYQKRNIAPPAWTLGNDKRIVLVVSGGEPSLQENLTNFLEKANTIFFNTQIESNGIAPIALPDKTVYVVSPKCLEKDGMAIRYLKPNKKVLERADCFKFVISVPEHSRFSPYSEVPEWAHRWAADTGKQVFVSPMNMYKSEPLKAKEIRFYKQVSDISIEERSSIDETISFWEPGLLDMAKNQKNHEYAAEYAMKHGFILNLQMHLYASLP